MEILEVNKISNVSCIVATDEHLAFIQDNVLCYKGFELHLTGRDICPVVAGKQLYLQIDGDLLRVSDTGNLEVEHKAIKNAKSTGYWVINENSFLRECIFETSESISLFVHKQDVWENEPSPLNRTSFLNEEVIVHFNDRALEVRALINYEIIYQFNTLQGYKVTNFVNMVDDIFVFIQTKRLPAPHFVETVITAVNLNSGEQLWQLSQCGVDYSSYYHQANDGLLYALISFKVKEDTGLALHTLNPVNGEHSKAIIVQEPSSVQSWNATINDEYFYASNSKNGCSVKMVNLNNKTMECECKLGLPSGVQISQPLVIGNKVYVLDSIKQLHELEVVSP
ncbi:hypothetical protein [Algibacillus agarilyticus]|uniref:hypothetical protein n=1 Tax=Algibacillus agarilyticus TaxID=2234133 RepID=UPI000DCF68E5|nr:hypothetical protein [Algibacillus agarilyticus]